MTSEKDIEIENEAKTTKNVRKQRKEIYIIIIIKKKEKQKWLKILEIFHPLLQVFFKIIEEGKSNAKIEEKYIFKSDKNNRTKYIS